MSPESLAAVSAGSLSAAVLQLGARAPGRPALGAGLRRWAGLLALMLREGSAGTGGRPGRPALAAACGAAAVAGFALFGLAGGFAAAAVAPFAWRRFLRARRAGRAAEIDGQAGELALAVASALSAGNSVRGALLAAGANLPQPIAGELDRVALDLTLGVPLGEALAALRDRTGSARIETLCGAIDLQRSSGGDLVRLMRELAAAFRAGDGARRDAVAASAQARYTLLVVAAIPIVLGVLLEFADPGAVSGALRFLPSALMLGCAAAMLAAGVGLARRAARL